MPLSRCFTASSRPLLTLNKKILRASSNFNVPLALAAAATTASVLSFCDPQKEYREPNENRFRGKTLVITGGGGTFGKVGGSHFAARGANVVLVDVNKKALEEAVAGALRASGSSGDSPTVIGLVCDIRDSEQVSMVVDQAVKNFGGVDLLWNNAGYQGEMKPLLEYPASDMQMVLDINVLGAFNVLQIVAREMAERGQGGAVVQTGSVAGLRGTPTMGAYVASKAAIHGLTMTAAKDLAPNGIRVNTISPALIGPEDGYMWARQNELHASSGSPYFSCDADEVARKKIAGVPLKRLGTVEEVIQTVDFLLSDDASYITGTNVVVAGGMA